MSKGKRINGKGARRCRSWIESFVSYTENTEAAPIWRKWAAIGVIAAALEQKVYIETPDRLFPNLYIFLVGGAGMGKTRAITKAVDFVRALRDPHIAPTSVTMASLVDCLNEAKRTLIRLPGPALEYNSLLIAADELSAFMSEWKGNELIPGLTQFYDVHPYGQGRRTNDLRIQIARPQLNIISGTTPSNLVRFVPDYAWEQGFTSRIILVHANERTTLDWWASPAKPRPLTLTQDFEAINRLEGQMNVTSEFQKAFNNWRAEGTTPKPTHPKLAWYCERRHTHLAKLAMISSVDRGPSLIITIEDFTRALKWLVEAETAMPEIFNAGMVSADSQAIAEIAHYVASFPNGVREDRVAAFASRRVSTYNILPTINMMVVMGNLKAVSIDPKTGLKVFKTSDKAME